MSKDGAARSRSATRNQKAASPPPVDAALTPAPSQGTPHVTEAPEPSRSFWARIDKPFVFGFLVTLGGLTAFLLALTLTSLSTVIIYIAFALFAALGLDPAVRFLERRGLSRGLSVLVVILGLVGVLALVLLMIVPVVVEQVTAFVTSVPDLISDFMRSDVYSFLERQFGDQFEQFVTDAQDFLTDGKTWQTIGGGALKIGSSIAAGISGAIVVLVLTLYFVAGLPTMKTSLLRFAPARDRARARDITDQITDSVGGYVQGMVTLAFINAIIVLILYLSLGLPFPPLLATVAFLITLIPLVGSVLFWAIGSVIALFADPWHALLFAVIYLVYMQLEAYFLTPRIMNKTVSVPGPLVVIGALAGGTLLGLLGALVAVPVTASILIIIKQIWLPRQDARI
ncbi:Membrane protein [Microbacterium esteraromaticum]|uniref:Membrane protein n=1 Tax=Microbacterium esteraromaticum TaxID=57043 RepID=A0A1R4K1X0_9MICO|nr:AI-2E family transporter [Microbacterium esteraromaticum]SJN38350.1 Membrane protein [Microbacterium esteraromaticum]